MAKLHGRDLDVTLPVALNFVITDISPRTRSAILRWEIKDPHTTAKILGRPATLRELQDVADDWLLGHIKGLGVIGIKQLRRQIGYP